jgi:GT2 family glycosyltransferase
VVLEEYLAEVSVVVVNYNGRSLLEPLFTTLHRQTHPAKEVIMVDNASTDGSVDCVRREFPWVKVIPLAENVGFAEGNNVGAAQAHGDFIALLNSDTTVDGAWLAGLVEAISADSRIGAVVPKIYRADAPDTIEQAGAEFNNLGHCWTRGYNQRDRGQFEAIVEVPALTGCSALLRRAALAGQPIFDRQFFMYYEEFELSLRLRSSGYTIWYTPAAKVYHRGMQSLQRAAAQPLLRQQFYCNRNRLKILFKYYPLKALLRNLPLIALSVLYWDWYFLRHAGPRYCLRAIAAQSRFAWQGLRERFGNRMAPAPDRWLPWMTQQGLRDVLALRAARGEA